MFTGLYPNQLDGSFERRMRLSGPTLAELFRERGYLTSGFVANLRYTSYESGLARGFVDCFDYRPRWRHVLKHAWLAHTPLYRRLERSRSPGDVIRALARPQLRVAAGGFLSPHLTFGRTTAADLVTSFLDWQRAHRDRPFFAFINFFDAHTPYQAPHPFLDQFKSEAPMAQGRYDAAIAYIDQEIGRLLGAMRDRGILDNTIVVLTADHGELFGEHRLGGHANSLYLPLLQVPLVIRFPPRIPREMSVAAPVTLRDLGATIVDLAGLGPGAEFPGRSLVDGVGADRGHPGSPLLAELERPVRPERSWPAWHGPMRTIFDRDFQYIQRGDGKEELYAYRTEGSGERDLAAAPESRIHLERLRSLLALAAEEAAGAP